MAGPILLPTTLWEGTTGLYTFQLVDEDGSGIPASLIETLLLTYYEVETETILNNRHAQDVYNAHEVTIATATGPPLVTTVTWILQPADTVIVNSGHVQEHHVMLFQWSWNSGTRHGAHVAQFCVENMLFVP